MPATLWLGEALEGENRFAEAETVYRQALPAREGSLGAAHPDTALAMDDLALALLGEGHYPEAEPLMRQALAIVGFL